VLVNKKLLTWNINYINTIKGMCQ